MAKLTIIGMEKYLNYLNDSLFKNLVFPNGIDKTLATNTCMLRAGEMEALYPDADFLKEQITIWGQRYYLTFQKWLEGFQAEYDPIENYDRMEDWTDSHDNTFHHGKTESLTHGHTESTTYGKTESTTHGKKETTSYGKEETVENGKTVTTTNEVSAYNTSGYVSDNKSTSENTGTDTTTLDGEDVVTNSGTDKVVDSGTDKTTNSGTDKTEFSGQDRDAGSGTHSGRIHGNIGVMTAPDMLQKYTEFYGKYNLYDLIADVFVSEFCIMVY